MQYRTTLFSVRDFPRLRYIDQAIHETYEDAEDWIHANLTDGYCLHLDQRAAPGDTWEPIADCHP